MTDEQGLIESNPVRLVKKPQGKARDRILNLDERKMVLGSIRGQTFKDFVFAMQETGARPGEVRKLTKENVNLDAGIWIFLRHKTAKKTGKPRIVYLTSPAMQNKLCLSHELISVI